MQTEQALGSAFQQQVVALYKQFAHARAMAMGDEAKMAEAQARFQKGLALAEDTFKHALILAEGLA